jgi:hypothetical protein
VDREEVVMEDHLVKHFKMELQILEVEEVELDEVHLTELEQVLEDQE